MKEPPVLLESLNLKSKVNISSRKSGIWCSIQSSNFWAIIKTTNSSSTANLSSTNGLHRQILYCQFMSISWHKQSVWENQYLLFYTIVHYWVHHIKIRSNLSIIFINQRFTKNLAAVESLKEQIYISL